ncbi:MAG: glycosyltransferase involved in cell wall biosynthesis [Vicingaceae bacterium]|jgi:glycosyltransferase involved in cell wall biosynthesis
MNKPQVQILLSTYNGSRFLREQLDSVLCQTYKGWQLLIRDDGSEDETEAIIKEYCNKFPKFMVRVFGGKGGNASISFMSMLPFVKSPYVMFCDQDDIWVPEKVQNALDQIQILEKRCPEALFFTDMKVVNECMEELFPSFFKQQKLLPQWGLNSNYAFVQSVAAGCTMIFTAALIYKLHPIKAPLFQHDHWLLMHAAHYGVVGYGLEKTVHYRQHASNVVGSHAINTSYFFEKIHSLTKVWERWRYIKKCFGNQISMLNLMKVKWELNKQRI